MVATPWDGYGCSIIYRGYQERALQAFAEARQAQRSRFYLVAPPGAGKTLMGLSMAESVGGPAVVLSPNAAIQAQWLSRLREHWVCLDPVLERFDPHPRHAGTVASPASTDVPEAVLSLTYQRISVKADTGAYHDNVLALHDALAGRGIGTLILDECHHLGHVWGQAVAALIERLAPRLVVGLTATPVQHAEGPLADFITEPDHEVSLPAVIRTGDLSPIQDLCHIVEPADDEAQLLRGCRQAFESLYSEVSEASEGRDSLGLWCESVLFTGRLGDGRPGDADALMRTEPELMVSAGRWLVSQQISLPESLPGLPDFYEPPDWSDRLRLCAYYGAYALAPGGPHEPLRERLRVTLRDWGFEVGRDRVRRVPGRISRALGHSRQKLLGMESILRTEFRHMGEGLCALVLTDYEFPPDASASLSCEAVMARLTSDAQLDELDPMMLTGKTFLVDDDLWPAFVAEANRFWAQCGLEVTLCAEPFKGYLCIDSDSRDWTSQSRVALATHLLESGVSRCLTGTRALLGEGWDCRRLNTLVDLTATASPVSVNQVRGRTVRKDPAHPLKTANNWDVLCMSALGGFADLDRLVEKHRHLYGVCDDGRIERGIGHIHGAFDRLSLEAGLSEPDAINEAMHQRAADRLGARARWRVGEAFADREFEVMSFVPRRTVARGSRSPSDTAVDDSPLPEVSWSPARRGHQRAARWLSGLGAATGVAAMGCAAAAIGSAGALPTVLATGAGLSAVAAWAGARRMSRRALSSATSAEELAALARVLAGALVEPVVEGPVETQASDAASDGAHATIVLVDERDDGTLRCAFPELDLDVAERVNLALAELLAPVRGCRYLLVEPVMAAETSAWQLLSGRAPVAERVFVVPRLLSQKTDAQRLLASWHAQRNPRAALWHRNTKTARSLLKTHLHTRPLGGEVSLHHVWC